MSYTLASGLEHVEYAPKAYATREEWLLDASDLIQQAIVARLTKRGITFMSREGVDLHPSINPLRISVGYPAHVRPSTRGKPVAECWMPEMVADGIPAVFISPELHDSYDVLEHLTHEICHVIAIHEHGHRRGGDFAQVARVAGLVGPLTSTWADVELRDFFKFLIERHLGEYEKVHSPLLPGTHIPTKTSLLKAHCSQCGFTARVSRKWAKVIDHKCPFPPIKLSGGPGGPPPPATEPEDELDLTKYEPPPGSGEGDDESGEGGPDEEKGESSESTGDSNDDKKDKEAGDDAAEGDKDAGDEAECGACGATVDDEAASCSACGAIFDDGDPSDDVREIVFLGGETGRAMPDKVKHDKDMCPFVTGCDFCEGSI